KQRALGLARAGYTPPKREKIPVVGDAGYGAMLLGAKGLHEGGYASDHDLKIAEKLAYVLSGGRIKQGTLIDDAKMLSLEKEAFVSLIGEPKTQQRMQHMLTKGKPLRNEIDGTAGNFLKGGIIVKEAVIVAGARTPVGRAKKGSLADTRPADLGAPTGQETLKRADK